MQGMARKYRTPGMMQVNSRGCRMAAVEKLPITAKRKIEWGDMIPSFWIWSDVPTITAVISIANKAPTIWAHTS